MVIYDDQISEGQPVCIGSASTGVLCPLESHFISHREVGIRHAGLLESRGEGTPWLGGLTLCPARASELAAKLAQAVNEIRLSKRNLLEVQLVAELRSQRWIEL